MRDNRDQSQAQMSNRNGKLLTRRSAVRAMSALGTGGMFLSGGTLGAVTTASANGDPHALSAGAQVPVSHDGTEVSDAPDGVHDEDFDDERIDGVVVPNAIAVVEDYDDADYFIKLPFMTWTATPHYSQVDDEVSVDVEVEYQSAWEKRSETIHTWIREDGFQRSGKRHLGVNSDQSELHEHLKLRVTVEVDAPSGSWSESGHYAVPTPNLFHEELKDVESLIGEVDDKFGHWLDVADELGRTDAGAVYDFGRVAAATVAHVQNDHVDLTEEDDLVRNAAIHGISGFEQAFENAPIADEIGGNAPMMGPTISVGEFW